MSVLIAISDLFFSSKVDGALTAAGAVAVRAKRGVDLFAQVRATLPRRVLLELSSRAYVATAVDSIRAIKADQSTRQVEIVGFCRHTEIELIRAAREAGADRVLTQGELADLLPALLDESKLPAKSAGPRD